MKKEDFYKKYSKYKGNPIFTSEYYFPNEILYFVNYHEDCIMLYHNIYNDKGGPFLLFKQIDLDYFKHTDPNFSIREWEVFEKDLEESFPTQIEYARQNHLKIR